jgi:hypothetical protein
MRPRYTRAYCDFTLCVLLACSVSCASRPVARQIPTVGPAPVESPPGRAPLQSGPMELPSEGDSPVVGQQQPDLIGQIRVSCGSFNPQAGQEVTIHYGLACKASVIARIYDPDFSLVRTLGLEGRQEPGQHGLAWDGRDADGCVVPDEAYFFTLTATDEHGRTRTYDPTLYSGGEAKDLAFADIDRASGAITYRLPVAARVLIRLGIQDGPLLNTLVDWRPRVAGEITEPCNGRDRDDLFDLLGHPRFRMLVTYFTLPENSVITYGNRSLDYRRYKSSVKADRPIKERPERRGASVSPHYLLARIVDYSPALKVAFSGACEQGPGEVPTLKGRGLVRVDIDEADRHFFVNQQYEITFFVDGEFCAEQEVGYTPLNWVWDLSGVKEGQHVLTVNLSGFKDQMAVLSRMVTVAK